jgi:hypothetical protein
MAPGEAGDDRIEWLPPEPGGGDAPSFDISKEDTLAAAARPAPDYATAPPPTGPPVQGPPAAQGPPTASTPPAWQQSPSQPWPQPYGKRAGNGSAIASLWLGIAGLVLFVFPAGFGLVFIFNLPASIAAWVLGIRGRRAVDRGEAHEHRGQAQTGIVLGVFGVVLGVLAIIAWTLLIIFSEEVRDELSRAVEEGREN